MTIPLETLDAFIDGKLPEEEASRIAADAANDPELAALIEGMRQWRKIRAWPLFGQIVTAAARAWHVYAIGAGNEWIAAGAMAAGIALGVSLAASYGMMTELRSDGASLIVQGSLAHTLDTALTGEQSADGAARIGISFWSKEERFCRTFLTRERAGHALAGIACRESAAWRVETMAATPLTTEGQRNARTPELPLALRNTIDNSIVGDPLSDEAERQARGQGWRPR